VRRFAPLLIIAACSASSDQKSFQAPGPESFRFVSDALHRRCGTLDCHGQTGRSLRLHGKFGLRLDPGHVPGLEKDTLAEVEANYASVLALEPELLAAVFRDGGRDAERLSLVRKGRDLEQHVGGAALGELGMRCFVSWLEGAVDQKTCVAAADLAEPPGFESPSAGGSGGSGGTPSGGSGGGPTGGSGGSVLGGSGGSGGAGTGGTTASGGSGGDPCDGGLCVDFWPAPHDEKCVPPKPAPTDHLGYKSADCTDVGCHGASGPATPFFIGGMIWEWGGKNPAPKIEVGLRDGATFVYTCTDQNGFFSIPATGAPSVNWLVVETRMRSYLGEKIMPSDKEHKATCNEKKCHGALDHQLWAP